MGKKVKGHHEVPQSFRFDRAEHTNFHDIDVCSPHCLLLTFF